MDSEKDIREAVIKYSDTLYKVCIVILCNEHDVQDAIQDTFCRYLGPYTASIAVRTEYSVVKIVSLGVSANCPKNAKLTQPSGMTSGLSPFLYRKKSHIELHELV